MYLQKYVDIVENNTENQKSALPSIGSKVERECSSMNETSLIWFRN
jgi:hypothetical protein